MHNYYKLLPAFIHMFDLYVYKSLRTRPAAISKIAAMDNWIYKWGGNWSIAIVKIQSIRINWFFLLCKVETPET